MRISMTRWFEFLRWAMLTGVLAWTGSGIAQEARNRAEPPSSESLSAASNDSVRELREQVRELQAAVAGMRSDWQRARAETEQLRRELDEMRAGMGPRNPVLTDAVAKSEATSAEVATGSSQDSSQNVLQYGAQEDHPVQVADGAHSLAGLKHGSDIGHDSTTHGGAPSFPAWRIWLEFRQPKAPGVARP